MRHLHTVSTKREQMHGDVREVTNFLDIPQKFHPPLFVIYCKMVE
jgi:hypothetical protein